jgi:Fe-S cluster assembly iron-binding protein IscA
MTEAATNVMLTESAARRIAQIMRKEPDGSMLKDRESIS